MIAAGPTLPTLVMSPPSGVGKTGFLGSTLRIPVYERDSVIQRTAARRTLVNVLVFTEYWCPDAGIDAVPTSGVPPLVEF